MMAVDANVNREEAESIANDLRQRIKGGESFEAIAKSESHCNTAG